MKISRRSFVAAGTLAAGAASSDGHSQADPPRLQAARGADEIAAIAGAGGNERWYPWKVDLSPAQWIWIPSQRVLPNTFVLFRKTIALDSVPGRALALIAADSRYRLTVNGAYVQSGPAPCDPRQLDVDPVDLQPYLHTGTNVLGVEVLFYGQGEGTWPAGKPGLLFHLNLGGQRIVSDPSWLCYLDRAHRPGMYKRWFLRALQEEFDARLHPRGWDSPAYSPGPPWMSAGVLECPADKPASCQRSPAWTGDTMDVVDATKCALRLRQIPANIEKRVPAIEMVHAGRVTWLREPDDWFEMRIPGSFRIGREPVAREVRPGVWELPASPRPDTGFYATFALRDQVAGWPCFTVDAPAGAIVELMTQEAHDPSRVEWLDTHFFAWSRFVCREGENHFQNFDTESLRWIQLHVRNASRPVRIGGVGVRRKLYAWPHPAAIQCSEPALQRLFDASVNTLYNSAIETIVDGAGRERQQYSGDGGHQLHAIRYALGDTRICRRFLRTFSEGIAKDGYFMDCWPAYDRLARVAQKQIGAAFWGPLLDHGVGFVFDCWNHYWETGEREALEEPYPRLVRFAGYLEKLMAPDGLLPVEDLGIPTVWMDHQAFQRPRHKQCSFNLYAAAMYQHALAPLAELFGEAANAARFRQTGRRIQDAAVHRYWSREHRMFVDNLPWLAEERSIRLSDRALATSVLYDQCPGGEQAGAIRTLAGAPPEMGLSYPCNAGWRYWALAKGGRADVVIREFRERWAAMPSVRLNNTLQEDWNASPDSKSEWSHCPLAPVYNLFMDIAGVRPVTPGFAKCRIRPQLGDLPDLRLTAYTVRGPISFAAERERNGHRVNVSLPADCEGEMILPFGLKPVPLARGASAAVFVPARPA